MSLKLSERHVPTRKAAGDISTAIVDAIEKYGLTYGEIFSILGEQIQAWAKYAVKDERLEEAQK